MTENNRKLWETSGLDYKEQHHVDIAKKAFFRGLEMSNDSYDPPVKEPVNDDGPSVQERFQQIQADRQAEHDKKVAKEEKRQEIIEKAIEDSRAKE